MAKKEMEFLGGRMKQLREKKLLLSGQGHTVMSLDTQGNRQNSSCAEIKSLFLIHLL